jgi:hypothetical protein
MAVGVGVDVEFDVDVEVEASAEFALVLKETERLAIGVRTSRDCAFVAILMVLSDYFPLCLIL